MTTPAIDPTKNVLDLVAAESRYRDELRISDNRYNDAMREKDLEFNRAMLAAAVKRTDDLYGALGARISAVEQFRHENSGRTVGATAAIGYVTAAISTSAAIVAIVVAVLK